MLQKKFNMKFFGWMKKKNKVIKVEENNKKKLPRIKGSKEQIMIAYSFSNFPKVH